MVMFPFGIRIEDNPEQWWPVESDPHADRVRVTAVLAQRRAEANPGWRPWPAPEVPMRVVAAGAAPKAPARLLSSLTRAQWRSVVTYARGTSFDAQRRSGRVVGSWAVRAALGNRRAVAVWWESGGRITARGVLRWGDRPAGWISITAFEQEI